MAEAKEKLYTLSEFREWIAQPEATGELYELINGEMIKVSPGRTSNSALSYTLAFDVKTFCKTHNLPCYISGGDGAYDINGHVLAPDFAYKSTPMNHEYPDPMPPVWVVEIISLTDKTVDIRAKRQIYLEAGLLYWELYPQACSVDVWTPGQPVRTFNIGDTLNGGDVLPGFELAVNELFRE